MKWPSNYATTDILVSCDWFALSCCLAAPRCSRPLSVPAPWSVVQVSPTAVWSDRFFILDEEGNKVATILCTPRSPVIDERRCLVEIANRWLYDSRFHAVCDSVLSCLPMSITGVNRVDLCADFQMTDALWRVFMRLARGDAYVKALRTGSVWWQVVDVPFAGLSRGRVPHCLTFGGVDSTFKWKVYWKWLELHQAEPDSKKPYISDLWKRMGFSAPAVWRLEVSVMDANRLAEASGRRLPPFVWFDEAPRVFADIYADKFVVRKDEGHKDKRNDTNLPFLDIDGMKSLWRAAPRTDSGDSDCERRLVCKLWKECSAIDVQANRMAFDRLRECLRGFLERPANIHALQANCGVDVDEIVRLMDR